MATEQEWQELLGRALADEAFRAQLLDDPRQAARDAGYALTEEQLAALKMIDTQTLAEALDERLVKKTMANGW
ncbi:MAG: Franean1_4349 family RiPP [Anaerolineae bacterium]|nr:Franean1_4349 family RiPP [Anaerolineae bacterium]